MISHATDESQQVCATVRRKVTDILAAHQPDSIVACCTSPKQFIGDYLDSHRNCRFVHCRAVTGQDVETILADCTDQPRFAFGLLADLFSADEMPWAETIIARCRDLHAERLLVLLPAVRDRGVWPDSDLVALGLRPIANLPAASHQLFSYDVESYRPAPDWLNARNWANPEMWNKHRW